MNSKVPKRFLSYIGKYKGLFSFAFLTCLIGTACTVVAPKILGEITTILYNGISDGLWTVQKASDGSTNASSVCFTFMGHKVGKIEAIIFIAVILVILYVLSLVFCAIANKGFAKIASYVVRDLRTEIDEKMHRMSLNYYDTRPNGETLSVITNDVDAINTLLGKNFYTVISQAISLVGVLIMLLIVNAWLALIAVLMIPGILLLTGPVQKKSGKHYADQQNQLGDVNGFVEEIYNGQNVITSFNYQKRATNHYDEINENLRKTAKSAERYAGFVMPLTQMVSYIGYAAAAIVGCIFAMKGTMTVGNVQSALQYINNFQQPFTTVSQMAGQLSSGLAAGGRIFDLLDAEEEVPDPEDGKVPEVCDGSVEFRHVQFGYTPDNLLMKDVSLKVEPGLKCAIVGPTGAGKTTLINLLMRFYEINGGEILVDGVNTTEMTRHELRTHFGMVLQETHLFSGTVLDNIRYGRLDATDEECRAAARLVYADAFIRRLPDGYDTILSADGGNLSQGERQLLAIARAAVADPPVLILDEATSSIDTRTEKLIQQGMDSLMKGRTTFVIAHRLSTVQNADYIAVLDHGRIIERGKHYELLEQKGKYYELYTGNQITA